MSQSEGTFDSPLELPPRIAVKFTIKIIDIKLFEYVYVSANLMDATNSVLDVKYYMIKDEEYNNWSNDDAYLIDLVKTKIQNEVQVV